MYLDVSAEEPEAFFCRAFVAPWTCLLLIRVSRLVDLKGPPKPPGRAQFGGILGLVLPLLLLLLLLFLLVLIIFIVKLWLSELTG